MTTISACVIHEVIKNVRVEGQPNVVTLDLSGGLLENGNKYVQQLLTSIHTSFGTNTGLKNTHFEPDQTTKFSTGMESYLKDAKKEKFYEFSVNAINSLKTLIEKENFATGGYYVFADYDIDGRRFVSVMVVRKNKDAINLQKVNNIHEPKPTENVNTDKVAMGFRLNYGIYKSPVEDKNYIALLTAQQDKDFSGYFKDWVNAAGIITHVKNSSAFIDIIKSIDIPTDEDGKELYSREAFQRLAHDFAENARKKIFNISAFSKYVYGEDNSNYIMNYASNHNIVLDAEFKRDGASFRRLITIHAKVKGIELNVDYDKLNPNEVDIHDDMIIIKSADLVTQIKAQQ